MFNISISVISIFSFYYNIIYCFIITILKVSMLLKLLTLLSHTGQEGSFLLRRQGSLFSECLQMLFSKNLVAYNDYTYIEPTKNTNPLSMYLGNEPQFWKMAKQVFNEFKGDHFWLKITGPGK